MANEWPTSLVPFKFLHAGYSNALEDNRHTFQPEVGRPLMRRKSSVRFDNIKGEMMWTQQQRNDAESYYENTLADGSLEFTAPHPETGETVQYTFQAPMQFRPAGLKYRVTMNLRMRPIFDAGIIGLFTGGFLFEFHETST